MTHAIEKTGGQPVVQCLPSPWAPWASLARAAQPGGPNIQRPQPKGPPAAVIESLGGYVYIYIWYMYMLYIYFVDHIPIIHMLIGKSFLSWFRNYKWLWIVSRIFQDSWKFAKILGISGNSGNPWNFKPLGLASVIQNLVPCSADFHEKCSRKVQTEKSQLTKFESPLGTASRVSERCLWVRPSLSRNFRGSCFFRGIRVSAIYFRELSRNSWQETWLFSCVTHHVYWNATKNKPLLPSILQRSFFLELRTTW